MAWGVFHRKHIKVVLSDGFCKYGILESEDDGFLWLRFRDGRLQAISKSTILSVQEARA